MYRSILQSIRRSRITRRQALGVVLRSLTFAAAAPVGLAARLAPAQETRPAARVTEAHGAVALPKRVSSRAARRSTVRERAARDRGYRIVVSLADRQLRVLQGSDLIMQAPVAVGSGTTVRGLGRSWTFETPRGVRTVQRKKVNPVWVPPDWMYVETAREHGLRVERLSASRPRRLSSGRTLVVRNGVVQVVMPGLTYTPPLEEHLVFDDILFIPPPTTKNRRIEGELGKYALDTGDGYMLHGTRLVSSVGRSATHGCLRLKDEDIAWLYRHVPVGTRVYLY